MKTGDLVQIQRSIRVHQCGPNKMNGLDDYFVIPSLYLQPGEIYLLTDFYKAEEDYPIYNYFQFAILAAGQQCSDGTAILTCRSGSGCPAPFPGTLCPNLDPGKK